MPSMPPPSVNPARDPYLGAVINERITLERLLGKGGMSRVYATAPHPELPVRAVKLLHHDLLKVDEAVKRFMREAAIMRELGEHPNILSLLESGIAKVPPFTGQPYIVMRLVRGGTLEDMLDERRRIGEPCLRLHEVVQIMGDIGAGVMAAHEHVGADGASRPVIHRDLKLSNVFVESHPGKTAFVVTDFGISCFLDPLMMKATISTSNIMGTPNYMAPEQARVGRVLTPKTDVYALGVMTYELLSGRLPIEVGDDDNTALYLERLQMEAPRPLNALMPGVSDELNALVMACLEKDPTNRPTVREFRDRLGLATNEKINRSVLPPRNSAARIERQILEGVPAAAAMPRVVDSGVVTGPGPGGDTQPDTAPRVVRVASERESTFDRAKTTQRDVTTDPALPLIGPPRWVVRLAVSGALATVLAAIGIAAYASVHEPDAAPVASGTPTPVPARHARVDAAVTRTVPDAGLALAVRPPVAPRPPPLPRGVEPPPVAPHVPPPPVAADPAIEADHTACRAGLMARTRPRSWEAHCQAYVAARCPTSGERAIDCDLVAAMLRQAERDEAARREAREEEEEPSP